MEQEFLPVASAANSEAKRRTNLGWIGLILVMIGGALFFNLLIADSPVAGDTWGVSTATGRDSDSLNVSSKR